MPMRASQTVTPTNPVELADLCRRLVLDGYAPAALLINRKNESLFSMGPTDRYLRVSPGHPTHDLLAMVPQVVRTKLRSAIAEVIESKTRIAVPNCRMRRDDRETLFTIDVQLAPGDELLLICFIDQPKAEAERGRADSPQELSRVSELERELDAARQELQTASRDLEISGEEQKAIDEEALSVKEEFQSTNEELLKSKEELQSLNEELAALKSQLQETLERQRSTSDDLQNILYSTDVATLFLDMNLNIRFFTPATKSLFHVTPSDLGRPLTDLNSLSADTALLADIREVLLSLTPLEREIETEKGVWFMRRILPYRTHSENVEGVVITFTDMSERKRIKKAMEESKQVAEQANAGKTRFLAMASHDLRQPLQTLTLLQDLLARAVDGEKAQKLVARLDDTLNAMTGMLNTLLDINQIEAGNVQPKLVTFKINDVLTHLRDEFAYLAQSQGLTLHVTPCSIMTHGDPRLLEQMVRNLLSNAMKYTPKGKVLVGCRRRAGMASVEIWNTGVSIDDDQINAIFDEFYQIGNTERARSRRLEHGLSIVQRLDKQLGLHVSVWSKPGKASVFSIEIPLPPANASTERDPTAKPADVSFMKPAHRTGAVLIVEDDPEVLVLLEQLLNEEGHHVVVASDGAAALALAVSSAIKPDILLTDFNLSGSVNGLQLAEQLRSKLGELLPVIVLTGDISTSTLRDIALKNCVQLNKPVKLKELTQTIQSLLPATLLKLKHVVEASKAMSETTIYVVDDDANVRETMQTLMEEQGWQIHSYASGEGFYAAGHQSGNVCLLVDAYLPAMEGLELLQKLQDIGKSIFTIMITGNSDVTIAVHAMKACTSDFSAKPVSSSELIGCIRRALDQAGDVNKLADWRQLATNHIAGLTVRQREIMGLVLEGHPSKNIAADLNISQRTVENHRASIMKKTGAKSLPALARLALAASNTAGGLPPWKSL